MIYKNLKTSLGKLSVAALILFCLQPSAAVYEPEDIAWSAPPVQFVDSLYGALFDRAATPAEISEKSAKVSTVRSRWIMFWKLVHTQEYGKHHGSKEGSYNVYVFHEKNGFRYTVAKQQPRGSMHKYGPFNFGIAQSLRGYYEAYNPGR